MGNDVVLLQLRNGFKLGQERGNGEQQQCTAWPLLATVPSPHKMWRHTGNRPEKRRALPFAQGHHDFYLK